MNREFWRLKRRGRLIAVAAFGLAALAVPGAALAAPAGHAAKAAPAIRSCGRGQTLVWFAEAPNATAGTIFYPLEFTNTGRTCWLRGYPRVAAVGRSGGKIGPYASRSGGRIRTIVLRHGQTAHAVVGIVEAGNLPGCHARTAFGLRVNPPGQRKQETATSVFAACSRRRSLNVSPIRHGIGVP
jgi:hypothetical protein